MQLTSQDTSCSFKLKYAVCVRNPMIFLTVRILKCSATAFSRNVVLAYAILAPWMLLNLMQFCYVFAVPATYEARCLYAFLTACILTAILRFVSQFSQQQQLETLLYEFALMYKELERSTDVFVTKRLEEATKFAQKVNYVLTLLAFIDTIISILKAWLVDEGRSHPFQVHFPYVNSLDTPLYELIYLVELTSPYVLTTTYMPFVHIFATFTLFMKTCLQVQQQRLKSIYSSQKNNKQMLEELINCIKYYKRIQRYKTKTTQNQKNQ